VATFELLGVAHRHTSFGTVGIMNTVLFACVHNAGRSQMAAAWFNLLADPSKARAISAGTDPGPRVHPEVVEAMNEVGIELSNATTKRLTEDLARQAQLLITMGCGDECPVVPGVRRDDWPLEDPKGKALERVREIRDEVRRRVETLLQGEGWIRS
jgi:arsenate reductase